MRRGSGIQRQHDEKILHFLHAVIRFFTLLPLALSLSHALIIPQLDSLYLSFCIKIICYVNNDVVKRTENQQNKLRINGATVDVAFELTYCIIAPRRSSLRIFYLRRLFSYAGTFPNESDAMAGFAGFGLNIGIFYFTFRLNANIIRRNGPRMRL